MTVSEEAQVEYSTECYGHLKGMVNELNRQLGACESQPPKIVFKPNSKFSQFIAPLLAGNSKTWIMGSIGEETSLNAIEAILDTLTK